MVNNQSNGNFYKRIDFKKEIESIVYVPRSGTPCGIFYQLFGVSKSIFVCSEFYTNTYA